MKKAITIGLICIVLLTIFISGCSVSQEEEFSTDYPVITIENHSTEYYITLDCGYVRDTLYDNMILFPAETIALCRAVYPKLWNNSDEENESTLVANPNLINNETADEIFFSNSSANGELKLMMSRQTTPKFVIDCDGLFMTYTNKSAEVYDISGVTIPIMIDCLEWEKNPPNSTDLKRIHSCVIIKGIKYGECEEVN